MPKIEYCVLTADVGNKKEFEENVMKKLNKGWELKGPISQGVDSTGHIHQWNQAMTKNERRRRCNSHLLASTARNGSGKKIGQKTRKSRG